MNLLKTGLPALACAFLVMGQAPAQESSDGNKVTVPLSSPSQPATVKLSMITGSVTLTAGATGQVIVDSSAGSGRVRGHNRDRDSAVPPGMHRIEMGNSLDVVEDHNVVTIRPGLQRDEQISIRTPVNTSVEIKAVNCGHVDVTGINGDMEVQCTNGAVDLSGVSGSVVAHTINGSITATLDKVSPDKPMSFTSFNGKVDVTLPADTKARLRLKTTNGAVFTDFDVKMESDAGKPAVESSGGKDGKYGKYRIVMDRGVYGSINGGGPEYLFQTMNGDILIHKK